MAIIYPSIGEGAASRHGTLLAKLFFDEGYSVIIQGSGFHWEFVKSMPQGFRPGLPAQDAYELGLATLKILDLLKSKYSAVGNTAAKIIQ